MKHKVSSKLLVLFTLISGIFFFANTGFCADDPDVIENKSSSFSTKLSSGDSGSSSDSALAEQIRAQRAAVAKHDSDTAIARQEKSGAGNSCDQELRKCITAKCESDYSKCATDTDTTFSDKLDACKAKTSCKAHEYSLFVNEIKEDKKQAISLGNYNKVIKCGNTYNDCIITACGAKFNKCLAKNDGDKAIESCKKIATECTEADSGMAGRMGSIFGIVRQNAEKQIKTDEKKLYALRDEMEKSCKSLGAMFDERSLDCVFTVSFKAGTDDKQFNASKKLYAGSLFDCTPDWFGIDVTTFKENAYRATRAQTAASSAMLGSGVGTAVGAITSGAIDRAIASKKAKNELKDACAEKGENWKVKDGKCVEVKSKKNIVEGIQDGKEELEEEIADELDMDITNKENQEKAKESESAINDNFTDPNSPEAQQTTLQKAVAEANQGTSEEAGDGPVADTGNRWNQESPEGEI